VESKSKYISKVYQNVPQELKSNPNWVVHENKVPFNPKTKEPAKSNDSATWGTFDESIRAYISNGYSGVGYCFTKPYVGVDIDKSKDLTVPIKLQSYTEWSPSGNGLHIICKGVIPRSLKTAGLEIYSHGRFFTVTGRRLTQFPGEIKECSGPLQEFFKGVDKENPAINKPGWISDALGKLDHGNIHNATIKIAGKLHRDGWISADIRTLLLPHVQRVGGNEQALDQRLESVAKYSIPTKLKLYSREAEHLEVCNAESIDELLTNRKEAEWVVNGLIPAHSITFIAGLAETRKSWLLSDLAIAATVGKLWLRRYPTKQQKVLFIDQERGRIEVTRRFHKLVNGWELKKYDLRNNLKIITEKHINLLLDRSFEGLKKKIIEYNTTLVLVDSFITFHGADENHRSSLQQVFERIKMLRDELGVTFVFLDHESKMVLNDLVKDREPNAHDMIGSSGKVAAAESVMTIRKHSDNSSIVYHTKSTCGPTQEPFLVKVEDVDDITTKVVAY